MLVSRRLAVLAPPIVASLVAATTVSAVSFDCAKAFNWVERTICADTTLGALDDALTNNYRVMLAANIGDGAKADLRTTQRQWLAERNQCTDAHCLTTKYRERIDAICDYPVISGVHPGPACQYASDISTASTSVASSESAISTASSADPAEPSFPLAPTTQAFAKLALDDGHSATTSEARTGHVYPNDYAIAVMQSEGRADFRSDADRECARRVVANIGNMRSMIRNRPSEATTWNRRLESEIDQIRNSACQRSPNILQAAMTFVRDVETEIAAETDRRRIAAEIQAEELREHAARTALAEAEARLQRQRESAEQRAPMQQRVAEAERQIAEHNAEIARLQAQEQRENEILAERERIVRETERARYNDDLRSGKRPIRNIDDAVIVFDAEQGFDIVARPLLRPDSKHYQLHGFIEHHDASTNSYVLYLDRGHARTRFVVFTNTETIKHGEGNARIDGIVKLVGQYIANDETILGTTHAVVLAKYVEFQ